MNFWGWILFSFNGRISRLYYWLAALVLFVISLAVQFALTFAFSAGGTFTDGGNALWTSMAALCSLPLIILATWVGLAVSVKRWHDRSKSGWWVLIGLIPIVGFIWVIIECGFLPGTDDINQYGVTNQFPADSAKASGADVAGAASQPSVETSSEPTSPEEADQLENRRDSQS